MRTCKINNFRMDAVRKTSEYQGVIIDLALAGVVDKDKAEKLLGYVIPSRIKLPSYMLKDPMPPTNGNDDEDEDEDEDEELEE